MSPSRLLLQGTTSPLPSGPPQGQVRHTSPSPNPANLLLQPGRRKAVLPTINWSFLSGSPSRHAAPCPGGLPFTLSLHRPLQSFGEEAFGHTAASVVVCSPASIDQKCSPTNRKRQQRTEEPVKRGGKQGAEGRLSAPLAGGGSGERAAPARPSRSHCGRASKSRDSQAINLLRPVSKKTWSTEASFKAKPQTKVKRLVGYAPELHLKSLQLLEKFPSVLA